MDSSEKEISAIQLYVQILWRRRLGFLTTVGSVLLTMLLYSLIQPKTYESTMLMLIGNEEKPQIVANPQPQNVAEANQTESLDTQAQILLTIPLISDAVNSLRSIYPELDAQSIEKTLNIKQLGKSGIISISYRDTNRERLLKVLSQLGKIYVNFSLKNRRAQVTNEIEFIKNELPTAKQNLEKKSQQLVNFKERNNLVDPSLAVETISKDKFALDQQISDSTSTLKQQQALYEGLKKRLASLSPDRSLAVASLSQDPVYQNLLKDYRVAENSYGLGVVRYTSEAPPLQILKDNRDELKRLLSEQEKKILGENYYSLSGEQRLNELQTIQVSKYLDTENALKTEKARLAALREIRSNLERQSSLLPNLQKEYDSLSLNVKVATDNLSLLLTKLDEFRILEARESPIWKIVQPPSAPGKPISPNLILNMMIALVLGLMLGWLVIYILERLDNRLQTADLVNQFLNIRTLGTLPKIDISILNSDQFSLIGSHYESHATNIPNHKQLLNFKQASQRLLLTLKSIGVNESLKSLGITSFTFLEGKTTCIRHLAICASEMGFRVLLIDADLRKPELHLEFEIPNQLGLSNIIEENIFWWDIIQNTSHNNLDLLTSGSKISDHTVLLESKEMKHLMFELESYYDLILIDLPPFVWTNEPLAIASHLDGLLLLVDLEIATRETINASLDALNYIRSEIVGVVYNKADFSKTPFSNLEVHLPSDKVNHKTLLPESS